MLIRKDHLQMIRKIAWSFYHTTGLEWEELFSEAALEYCEAVVDFKSNKKIKLSTYAYSRIQRRLINYCKKEHRDRAGEIEDLSPLSVTPEYEYYQTPISNPFVGDVLDYLQDVGHLVVHVPPTWIKRGLSKFLRELGCSPIEEAEVLAETQKILIEKKLNHFV